jgi:hypothetical protein
MRVYSGAAWLIAYLPASGYAVLGANTFTAAQEWATGASIASASTINLDTATGNRVHITGTTAITAVTLTRGPRTVIFDGILTLTHNATTNNLPGAANITTAAGDRAIYESDGTTVYCVSYIKASGAAVVASPANEFNFIAEGAITAGKAVILKSSGKVAQSVIASGSAGTAVNLSGNNSSAVSTCYDPVNDKFVVFYRDDSDSGKGKAVVGTVSGSTVSFGTPVIFYNSTIYTSSSNNIDSCYDPVTGQIIIAFSVGGSGHLRTCTVSGTTATFGADFDTGSNQYDGGICYDVSVSRVLYAFRDGAAQKASVILVSGTSLSIVSTETAFGSSVNGYTSSVVHCLGHGTAGTNVICCNVYGQAYIVVAKINPSTFALTFYGGTPVSYGDGYAWGRSIAWSSLYQRLVILRGAGPSYDYILKVALYSVGTSAFTQINETTVDTGSYSSPSSNFPAISCSIDGTSVCVVFPNQNVSLYGYLKFSGTFTASSIAFSFTNQFQTNAVGWTSVAYDANNKTLTGYSITSGLGRAFVAIAPKADLRTSFIGFAKSTVADGATVTAKTLSGVINGQSGLTPNVNYFLSSTDGSTLTTTIDGPRVGRAVSATELLVLGSNVYS